MKHTYCIFILCLMICACNTASEKSDSTKDTTIGSIQIINQDTTQSQEADVNAKIDTIEDRELDPWEEYTMTKEDTVLYKQLSGSYFVPHAAGINMTFSSDNGTCNFYDFDEQLQQCVYQVQKNKLYLYSSNGTQYIFDIKPAISAKKGFRFVSGEYIFVQGDAPAQ